MNVADRVDDFIPRLESAAGATETALDALLAPTTLEGEISRPARLLEAMRYATLGGGKRLRPFLVIEIGPAFRRDRRRPASNGLRAGDDSLLLARA